MTSRNPLFVYGSMLDEDVLWGNAGLEEAEALWEQLSARDDPGRKLGG